MKANTKRVSLLAVILTVALMFSLFSISVFAETDAPAASSADATGTEAPATGTETAGSTSTSAPSSSASATTTANGEEGKDIVSTIVSLSILGVILVVVALFCIIKREKVGKFFRSLKSETKKVVWMPWDQVRKNTVVVIIVVVAVAILIGVLDFAFSKGIIALGAML